jgi:hypothetical protein
MGQSSFSGPVASQNGFIPGSFTTAELAAMTGVATGTLVFNTTTDVAQVYNGTAWVAAFGGAPGPTFPITYGNPTGSVIGGVATLSQFAISTDGTQYITETPGGGGYSAYTLATPWDITTVGSTASSSVTATQATQKFCIDAGGNNLLAIYSADNTNFYIYQATFGTPWNLTTLSTFTQVANITTLANPANSINVSADGTKVYIGQPTYTVFQYTLPSAYNFSSFNAAAPTATINFETLMTTAGLTVTTNYAMPYFGFASSGTLVFFQAQKTGLTDEYLVSAKLNTAYDLSSITTPVNGQLLNAISGGLIGYMVSSVATVAKSDASKVILSTYDNSTFADMLFEFTAQ